MGAIALARIVIRNIMEQKWGADSKDEYPVADYKGDKAENSKVSSEDEEKSPSGNRKASTIGSKSCQYDTDSKVDSKDDNDSKLNSEFQRLLSSDNRSGNIEKLFVKGFKM